MRAELNSWNRDQMAQSGIYCLTHYTKSTASLFQALQMDGCSSYLGLWQELCRAPKEELITTGKGSPECSSANI
jgi:lipocalin